MRRVRDWAATAPFLISFGLCLLVFDLAGRITRPFSLRTFEVVMAALQRTLMALFAMCGTRIEVERSPEVRPRTGYVIISNHQSMLDIALIGGVLFSNFPKYVAKQELGRFIPSVSLNLRRGGNALIDRRDRRQSLRAIKEMAEEAQQRGVSVVIFPEGTRSRDGRLGEFKRAGSVALLEAADQLPVVPVAIDGSWRVARHNLLPVPWGSRVRMWVGAPLPRRPGDAREILERAHGEIAARLAAWAPAAG